MINIFKSKYVLLFIETLRVFILYYSIYYIIGTYYVCSNLKTIGISYTTECQTYFSFFIGVSSQIYTRALSLSIKNKKNDTTH